MTSYSRRRILRDFGALSATAAIARSSLARTVGLQVGKWPPPSSSNDLYIIFSGPWLFWMNNDGTIQALTIDYPNHFYTFFDSLIKPYVPTDIDPNNRYTLTVPGSIPAPSKHALIDPMTTASQGLIYNGNVSLIGSNNSGVRSITVPTPTWILPAALMTGVQFDYDPNSTYNQKIVEWPSALLFIYSGWSNVHLANQTDASVLDRSNVNKPAHIEFNIQPIDSSTSACDDTGHAPDYFAQLMKLLKFSNGKCPSITIPPCSQGQNPISVRRGDDPNVGCDELGLGATCSNTPHPLLMAHQAKSAFHQHKPFVQLVNCAAGHGGVGGG
jgi:hypothetical protein